MTAPNLALPDRTGLTSHRTRAHNTHTKVPLCVFLWVDINTKYKNMYTVITATLDVFSSRVGTLIHADTLAWRLVAYICCTCVLRSLAAVWCWCILCLGLFELLESKPSVAVKVLLDGLSRAKRGYTETVADKWEKSWQIVFSSKSDNEAIYWLSSVMLCSRQRRSGPQMNSWLRRISCKCDVRPGTILLYVLLVGVIVSIFISSSRSYSRSLIGDPITMGAAVWLSAWRSFKIIQHLRFLHQCI